MPLLDLVAKILVWHGRHVLRLVENSGFLAWHGAFVHGLRLGENLREN